MNMLTSGVFWGTIIILFGLSLILKAVFNINFPFFRIIIGVVIIYFGLKIISGGWSASSSGQTAWMGKSHHTYIEDQDSYSIVFGQGVIDLRDLSLPEKERTIEAQIIFGDGKIIVPKNHPLLLDLNAAFGQITLKDKDKSVSGIGSSVWKSPEFKAGQPHTKIKASAVFGQAVVEIR